mgnify:CR=1 FL=1
MYLLLKHLYSQLISKLYDRRHYHDYISLDMIVIKNKRPIIIVKYILSKELV